MTASDDEDALLDSLERAAENDPALLHLREARRQQLAADLKAAKQQRAAGYGSHAQIRDEKDVLDLTAAAPRCVVHFSRPDFPRCRIMDGHLAALAAAHLGTRFVAVDVARAPFLVARLKVRVLPCVIAFVGGVSADRVVGFEGLGSGEDTFTTADLEKRLVGAGVLDEGKGPGGAGSGAGVDQGHETRTVGGSGDGDGDDDDDDDDEWD